MLDKITQETLELFKTALGQPYEGDASDVLKKIFTQATGLVYYDLQAPALRIYPLLTPLRNELPRVPGDGGTATHWKRITGLNITNLSPGVSEGNRGGIISTATDSQVAAYKTLGFEDFATWQADWAARNFDDIKARAVEGTLRSLMMGEEKTILGGNASLQLLQTNQPVVSASNAGGNLTAAGGVGGVYSVICVALSFDGYWNSSVAGGIPGQISRTNADGSVDVYGGGNAQASANNTGSITAGSTAGSLSCSVTPTVGACGYAWYCGAAGSERLFAITTINSCLITAVGTGPLLGNAAAADYSTNALVYDGLLTQIQYTGSNSYIYTMPTGTPGTGTGFHTDGAGGILELNTAFLSFWNNFRLSPEKIWCSAYEALNMNTTIVKNGGAPLIRFNIDAANAVPTIEAGVAIGSVLNKITNQLVKIEVHPNMPPGTIVFYTRRVPYQLTNVGEILVVRERMGYFQVDWPRVKPRYEYGCYMDGLLQCYFPPAFGMINNIGDVTY